MATPRSGWIGAKGQRTEKGTHRISRLKKKLPLYELNFFEGLYIDGIDNTRHILLEMLPSLR